MKRYLKLNELVQVSGLSEATIRRRVKDGGLPFHQPGGPRTILLFPVDAIERANSLAHGADGADQADLVSTNSPSTPSGNQFSRRGPRPRWKR